MNYDSEGMGTGYGHVKTVSVEQEGRPARCISTFGGVLQWVIAQSGSFILDS